jgi:hypothetical protein
MAMNTLGPAPRETGCGVLIFASPCYVAPNARLLQSLATGSTAG